MKRKVIAQFFLSFCFILASFFSHGQQVTIDTLKPTFGILSKSDTLHRFFQSSNGVFPIMDTRFPSISNPFLRYLPLGSFLHPQIVNTLSPKYIALPFVGFAYVFGSHGSQHINLAYHQSFRGGWIFNNSFLSHAGGGMIRNNYWRYRTLNSSLFRVGKRNTFSLQLQTLSDSRPFSLGLQQPLLANDFTIDLLPVRKDSCRADWKIKSLEVTNSLRLAKDSLSPLRLFHSSSIHSKTRNFDEYDTLAGWYPLVQGDSLRTKDRYEYVAMQHQLGLSYVRGPLSLYTGPHVRYWRARFNGIQSDSSEWGVNLGFTWMKQSLKIQGQYDKNFIGAYGEQRAQLMVHYAKDSLLHWRGTLAFGRTAPDVFQRWYNGNTVSYQLMNPTSQTFFVLNLSLQGQRNGYKYRIYFQGLQTQGVYQFDGLAWTNQASSSECTLGGLGGDLDFSVRGFRIRPGILCVWDSEKKFPISTVDLLVNKTFLVKKPKNLQFFTTLDLSYCTGFSPLAIHPAVSAFDFESATTKNKGYMSLVTLVGFKVQTFRFFLSGTNLGYFFQPNANELFQNYPLPPWQIKVGITWDFWN